MNHKEYEGFPRGARQEQPEAVVQVYLSCFPVPRCVSRVFVCTSVFSHIILVSPGKFIIAL